MCSLPSGQVSQGGGNLEAQTPVGPSLGEPWGQPLLEHLKNLGSYPDVILEAGHVSVAEVSHKGVVCPLVISLSGIQGFTHILCLLLGLGVVVLVD